MHVDHCQSVVPVLSCIIGTIFHFFCHTYVCFSFLLLNILQTRESVELMIQRDDCFCFFLCPVNAKCVSFVCGATNGDWKKYCKIDAQKKTVKGNGYIVCVCVCVSTNERRVSLQPPTGHAKYGWGNVGLLVSRVCLCVCSNSRCLYHSTSLYFVYRVPLVSLSCARAAHAYIFWQKNKNVLTWAREVSGVCVCVWRILRWRRT